MVSSTLGFHVLLQLVTLLIMFVLSAPPLFAAVPPKFPVAKDGCVDRCGNMSIPFPFGMTEDCYLSNDWFVKCNEAFNPPKLLLGNSSIEIIDISLDGQLRLLNFIAKNCYDRNGSRTLNIMTFIQLTQYITVNYTANKFTVLGCDSYGYITGLRLNGRSFSTGCIAMCNSTDDLSEGSCGGLGCCQTSTIPNQIYRADLTLNSVYNHSRVWDFNKCSYAFLAEASAFNFSRDNFTSLQNVEKLPVVVDWAMRKETCKEAQMNLTSYACKGGINSRCDNPTDTLGYRCSCEKGYEGNPYLDECKDIDECRDSTLNNCEKIKYCRNTEGSFHCRCPKWYHGEGIKGAKGCIRGESLMYKLVAGIALGIIVVLLVIYLFYLEHKRRIFSRMKQKYFLQNGGAVLQEKLAKRERSPVTVKIFSSSELQNATNNFHTNMIIGQGGYGIVYKGFLTDNTIVAVKKSKVVDPNQTEQFINEVIVLSQINHRNVVKLLGCCLETQAPLLVYEFINNGTLFEHIHNKSSLNWDSRLKIAVEMAGVLSYLHSDASTPIVHRDVKSANILLDEDFTAKVSHFGASRLVLVDQTRLSTMVQGTFGYLDPEYMLTNHLTEKSDVFSFGVVLVELLTGMKALSYDRPEEERNLSNFFLSTLKQEQLFQILDGNIVSNGNRDQLTEVARLAKGCLNIRGEDRPSMKEVAMELEGLRLCGKHSWHQTEQNADEMELLIGERLTRFDDGRGNSTSVGYDSHS